MHELVLYRLIRVLKKSKKNKTKQRKTLWHDIALTQKILVKTCLIDPICMFNYDINSLQQRPKT